MITALDKHTALVLINLQAGILSIPLAHDAVAVVANAARLAEAFRRAGLPVVLVTVSPLDAGAGRAEQNEAPQDAASQEYVRKTLADNGFFTLDPALNQQSDDLLLIKTAWNAFYGTDLEALLAQRRITGLVLGGVATSIGVEGTARAASERGYNLSFAEDALSDFTLAAHAHSLATIFPRIGEIGATATLVAQLADRS